MKFCAKCFERKCKCQYYKIEIDYLIYPAIYELNRKGYSTSGCCSGHSEREDLGTYIQFESDVEVEIDSEFIQFESYNYRGVHVIRSKIVPKMALIKQYKKKRTNKSELVKTINKNIYEWARSIPVVNESDCIKKKYFDDDYFTEERYIGDKSPWILLRPGTNNGNEVISDYLDTVPPPGVTDAYYIGPYHQVVRYDRYSYTSMESTLKDAVNISPKMFAFGKNDELHLDAISVRDSRWVVAYTSPQDSFYIDEDDLDDYLYEHPDIDTLSTFRWIFEILFAKGSDLCIFSSGDTFMVFTNKAEFAYHASLEYSAFLVGEIDYDEMELKHVIPKKEVFIFAGGALLLREELK